MRKQESIIPLYQTILWAAYKNYWQRMTTHWVFIFLQTWLTLFMILCWGSCFRWTHPSVNLTFVPQLFGRWASMDVTQFCLKSISSASQPRRWQSGAHKVHKGWQATEPTHIWPRPGVENCLFWTETGLYEGWTEGLRVHFYPVESQPGLMANVETLLA